MTSAPDTLTSSREYLLQSPQRSIPLTPTILGLSLATVPTRMLLLRGYTTHD